MATVAERQAERERRRREAEERKKQKEQAEQQQPDQVTVVGGDPNFQLGNGVFSILGIAENQALGGAQVVSDQVQFRNARDQRQFGGIVGQVVGGQPVQQNNQQAGQQPAGPNVQPNNQQAGAAGVQPGQGGQQPGQENPAAEGDEPPDLLKRGAGLVDEDDIEVEVSLDNKGGKSRHRDFVNFLATDKVPGSIFGIPVVQDESQYTEKDLEFFKRNPKAAGFYDLGDEEVDEDVPQQAVGAGTTYDTQLTKEQEARYQGWRATLPKPLQYEGDYDLRGYWLDPKTVKDGIKDGQHFTDKYKKPNHPTFSVESKYAVGTDARYAGSWNGGKFVLTPEARLARDERAFAERNPTLIGHVKSFEKLHLKPYEDVGGYAIGYGAHMNHDGTPVTKDTAEIEAAQADLMLARDLYARREALAKSLPNWSSIPGAAKQALLDVSMGRDDVLSKERSPRLHEDLTAAGKDTVKLLAAVKKHYYSYRKSERPEDQSGLEARRISGGKAFFGEDFSYKGKTWDPDLGFVKKGGK